MTDAERFVANALRWLDRAEWIDPQTLAEFREQARESPERFIAHFTGWLDATSSRGFPIGEGGDELLVAGRWLRSRAGNREPESAR